MPSNSLAPSSRLRFLYPDAHAAFSWAPRSLESMADTCKVVLDSSVLIRPYELAPDSLEAIKDTLRRLKQQDRLRIPVHALREFLSRRPQKLVEILKQVSDKEKEIPGFSPLHAPLLGDLPQYQSLLETERAIKALGRQYRNQLAELAQLIRSWEWQDPLSEFYRDLIDPAMLIETEMTDEELMAEFQERSDQRIPPGFMDRSKSENSEGDLAIWRSILEMGEREAKGCLFVTNDTKQDWWHLVGKEAIVPRFELVEEYRRSSAGENFRMVSLSKLLEVMGVSDEVVDDVKIGETGSVRLIVIEEIRSQWTEVVNAVSLVNRRIAQLLQSTHPIGIQDNVIFIDTPYEFHAARLADPQVMSVVEGAASTVLGTPLRVTLHPKVPKNHQPATDPF